MAERVGQFVAPDQFHNVSFLGGPYDGMCMRVDGTPPEIVLPPYEAFVAAMKKAIRSHSHRLDIASDRMVVYKRDEGREGLYVFQLEGDVEPPW